MGKIILGLLFSAMLIAFGSKVIQVVGIIIFVISCYSLARRWFLE
jgi:hypothetical protein